MERPRGGPEQSKGPKRDPSLPNTVDSIVSRGLRAIDHFKRHPHVQLPHIEEDAGTLAAQTGEVPSFAPNTIFLNRQDPKERSKWFRMRQYAREHQKRLVILSTTGAAIAVAMVSPLIAKELIAHKVASKKTSREEKKNKPKLTK